MLSRTIITLLLTIPLLISGCSDITNSDILEANNGVVNRQITNPNANTVTDTILDIAVADENFSVLEDAVIFAGLTDVLNGNRQLTVFAPTNDAFIALLNNLNLTAEQLFVEENKGLVRDILLYHVAPGKRQARSVVKAEQIRMLLGKFTEIDTDDGNVFIGNEENGFAKIIQTDIFASNGVIHVIDAVLLPPSSDDDDNNDDENEIDDADDDN